MKCRDFDNKLNKPTMDLRLDGNFSQFDISPQNSVIFSNGNRLHRCIQCVSGKYDKNTNARIEKCRGATTILQLWADFRSWTLFQLGDDWHHCEISKIIIIFVFVASVRSSEICSPCVLSILSYAYSNNVLSYDKIIEMEGWKSYYHEHKNTHTHTIHLH